MMLKKENQVKLYSDESKRYKGKLLNSPKGQIRGNGQGNDVEELEWNT